VTNVSSLLPGMLVQSLITAVVPNGLNLQVLGFFEGTIDLFHLLPGSLEDQYKVGKKIKARILYDITASSPPRFALSLAEHVVGLDVKRTTDVPLQEAYPIGTILDAVKVTVVEAERGLSVEVEPGVSGFVHVRDLQNMSYIYILSMMSRFHKHQINMSPLWLLHPAIGRLVQYTGLA
jgi:rRNA biogenesis protein RRP5